MLGPVAGRSPAHTRKVTEKPATISGVSRASSDEFDEAMGKFALAYADQVERDPLDVASRSLAEKAPNPRSSTRSPRRKASIISFSIALTTFSMSRSKRCGFFEEMRFMSSDFIMDPPR